MLTWHVDFSKVIVKVDCTRVAEAVGKAIAARPQPAASPTANNWRRDACQVTVNKSLRWLEHCVSLHGSPHWLAVCVLAFPPRHVGPLFRALSRYRGMATLSQGRRPPFPRDGNRVSDGWNPLSEGWQPLYRGLWTHFPSDGDQGMGTPLPKDGNSVPEGWGPFCLWMARAEYAHFQRERSHMLSWVLGGQNASPTPVNAWRKTFSTGSRPPTWRETLGSIYPVTP